MMDIKKETGFLIAIILIALAAIYRVIPHPPNFAPITGIALFGGAVISQKRLAILVPLLAVYISDLVLNNTLLHSFFNEQSGFIWFAPYMLFVFFSYLLISSIGILSLKKLSVIRVGLAAICSSILFYLITNFGSWIMGGFYPKNFAGLLESYTAAIPFFRTSLIGDLVFTGILFGSYAMISKLVKERSLVTGDL